MAQHDTVVFQPVNNAALRQWDLRKITIAKDGKLWLSTGNGVASFDGSDVRFFGQGEGGNLFETNKSISRCYFDSVGNLYCLLSGGLIYYLNTKTNKLEKLNIHVDAEDSLGFFFPIPYTEMLIDQNMLWVGRNNMGFMSYDLATKKTRVYNIYSDKGNMPLTEIPSNLKLDDRNRSHNTVNAIKKDWAKKDVLWFGTGNGIYSFNTKTKELKRNFHCYNRADSSSTDVEIIKLDVSSKDTIWFTAAERGVGFYEISSGRYTIFPYQTLQNKKDHEDINIIFFQRRSEDEYYIGMRERNPGIFNKQTHSYIFNTKFNEDFPSYNISHVIADSSGNLWCILFNQLYVARAKKNKFSSVIVHDINSKSITTNALTKVIWNENQNCYYAAFDNSDAIFVLDSNKIFLRAIPINSFRNGKGEVIETSTYDIVLDKNGRLWSCGSSLNIFNPATKTMMPVQKLYPKISLDGLRIQNIVSKGKFLYLHPSFLRYKAIYRIDVDKMIYDSIPLPTGTIKNDNVWVEADKEYDALVIDRSSRYGYLGIHNVVVQIDFLHGTSREVVSLPIKPFAHFFNMQWYAVDDEDNLWVSANTITKYEPRDLQLLKTIDFEKDTYHEGICNANGKGVMCLLYSQGVWLFDYKKNRQYHLAVVDGLTTLFNSSISFAHDNLFVGAELNALQYISLGEVIMNNNDRRCYVSAIKLFDNPYFTDTLPEYLHSLTLAHDQNNLTLSFSTTEFQQTPKLFYRYRMEGLDKTWRYTNASNNSISYNNIPPGSYTFIAFVINSDGRFSTRKAKLIIHILPAWWQTRWFLVLCIVCGIALIYLAVLWRIKTVRKQERLKSLHEKELLELEAKALRAQMNPHFIFNCMNSIKSLIQEKNEDAAVKYLTTFSKLIRTIFQNSDKREISLYDEIETCRLYTQLESMRFDKKFNYSFSIDETIDLKSLKVPALIIQPFIENAIWHGIMPKENGGELTITVRKEVENVVCIIDDNGIGRESSKQNKFMVDASTHQSKGVHLTQNRLDLDNLLNDRNDSLVIIDKKNEEGVPEGTTVIISFSESNS